MKDQRKNRSADHTETQSLDEQVLDVESSDDTQRIRTLNIQELERLLKYKKPGEK
jgi:predicted nucleic acid-binding Zn ribbon protein